MSMRSIATAVALAACGAMAAEPKQALVATLKTVEGNVLVSAEAGLGSADAQARLTEGSRVITTANAKAIVEYDDGCEVKLEPNQRLEIDARKPCRERIARAESILREPAGMMLAGGTGGAAAAVLGGSLGAGVSIATGVAGVAGVAAIADARGDRNTSPN